MQPHVQHIHNVERLTRVIKVSNDDRIALLASLSGSQGVHTMWLGLLNGATLFPFPTIERGVIGLANWMSDQRITVYVSSASLFRNFTRTLDRGVRFPVVRMVRIASEVATANDFAAYQHHFGDGCVFIHTFSATETSTIAHFCLSWGDRVKGGRLPVGHAAEGIEILLVDDQNRPVVDRSLPSEIVVRSRYISKGYWRNESLTDLRFLEGANGIYDFHTGDIGRFNESGLLEIVGRKDARVKIRGYSIDIPEVEEAILALPVVQRAAVCAVTRANGDNQLVAYVVGRQGQDYSEAILRRSLDTSLPRYMVPSAFIYLSTLPLTSNGKIDRAELRLIAHKLREARFEEYSSELERLLAGIWAEALEVAEVGSHDDFFELGGDSLVASEIAARVYAALGIELNLGTFFDHPTPAALASVIEKARASPKIEAAPPLVRVPRPDLLPLSSYQEQIWNYSQTPDASAGYTATNAHRILGPLDSDLLIRCLRCEVNRHEIMRTTYSVAQGRPFQFIHAAASVPITLTDVSGLPDVDDHATLLLNEMAAETSDLENGPLIRFSLLRINENEHLLLRSAHHIACDGASWKIFMQELAQLYKASQHGEPAQLTETEPLQYADYAVWQRGLLDHDQPRFKQMIAWWKNELSNPPPPLRLPFRRPSQLDGLDPNEGIIERNIDPQISRQLVQLGREENATYYVMRLAAFVCLLSFVTGQSDLLIGCYVTQRDRQDLQNIFGCFSNLVTLRFRLDPTLSFRQTVHVVRRAVLGAEAHSEISYEDLHHELQKGGGTPIDIRLIFGSSFDDSIIEFSGLKMIRVTPRRTTMPWGFSITINKQSERFAAWFDAGIYDPVGVQHFVGQYFQLLEIACKVPDLPMCTLTSMMSSR
jgi:acyl carrier protein